MKKLAGSNLSLYSILQILSVNAFEQQTLHQLLSDSVSQSPEDAACNQLVFSYQYPDSK